MYKTSFKVSLFVIILMLPWAVAQAAGLGRLTLNSALGQPFSAEIDIVSTGNDELSSLKASVATREAFTQAGINYESILSAFKVSIETRANGNPYIKLTSLQAVNDPFLMLLMELNWSSGRILREYTVLLDPVESPAQNQIAPNTNPPPLVGASEYDTERSPRIENNNPIANSASSTDTSNRSSNTYGPVNRGDTLSSIAIQVLPAGVDLNQMLVALYRANREAFIANNMNLLKTGAILKVPEKNEITAIDSSTARAEIKTQIADWRNYRGRLATINQEAPAPHAISQSDQGQITSIDKKSTSIPGAPKEVLKLSSGAQLLDQDGQIAESSLIDRLRMMEEDAIARNLALKEANERVAMLEKSVENLKQLLELKDSVLAQAQIKAESIPTTINKPELHFPPDGVSVTENVELDSTSIPEEVPVIQPAAEAPVINAPSMADEEANRSLLAQAYDYIEYIGAALILLLLLILLILKRRRNRSQDDEEIDDTEENFSSTMRSRIASMAAAKAAPVTEEDRSPSENMDHDQSFHHVDSYSQAEESEKFDKEVDLSYEDSAEHTLQSDFDAESTTESQINDETILEHSQAIHGNLQEDSEEGFSRPIASAEDKNSAELANQIDFDLSDEADEIATEGKRESKNTKQIKEAENVSDYAVEIDLDEPEQSLDTIGSSNKVAEKNEDDFEFSHSEIDLTDNQNPNEIEIPVLSEESSRNSEEPSLMDDNSLEFERSPGAERSEEGSNFSSIPPEIDLAAINLDLEDANVGDNKDKKEELNAPSEAWQEVETKLDLAKAYQEMDDKEGAKEMLEEVIRDGDTKQKKAARKILKDLR
ncbi:FimV/HubP family polar landmark protein [Nitrosomonas ureae]|uniref:FimV/HubP family polar landmark protein n=1 Tax=Nitrosomonas ureae TaxID=44577 RepID=UPI001E58953A|nr:FimV/HubP family polar landmark protein [Nitrosomonas ureae]